jgi:hypothetical protein
MKRSLLIRTLALGALLALAACSSGGTSSSTDVVIDDGLGQPDGYQGPAPCNSDADCLSGVCVVALGACMECADDNDCSTEEQCYKFSCIKRPPCLNNADCEGIGRCDTVAGLCDQCVEDSDCGASPWRCDAGVCALGCNANRDCVLDTVCDTVAKVCVECLVDEDCPSSSFCETSVASCLPDLCKSGSAICTANGVAACRLNGSGWAAAEACPEGSACVDGACKTGLLCSPGLTTCKDAATVERCNNDGLGFTDSPCGDGKKCDKGACITDTCIPTCGDRECGPDGCGGNCGTCADGEVCDGLAGQCEAACTPSCNGKECGNDGCGGSCGLCGDAQGCTAFQCIASLSCKELVECSMDCGGVKACEDQCWDETSPEGMVQWLKVFNCVKAVCGSWGGTCTSNAVKEGGACRTEWSTCLDCTPDCQDRQCGADGCGGTCGTCANQQACTEAGYCACTPACDGKECGGNGCGGSCGTCPGGYECDAQGACQQILPSCGDGECNGDEDCASCADDCGPCDSCGDNKCQDGETCASCAEDCSACADSDCCAYHDRPGCEWKFISDCVCNLKASCCSGIWSSDCVVKAAGCGGECDVCKPDCQAIECGDDGCGGSCGTCGDGQTCLDGLCTGGGPEPTCREMFDCAVECGFADCEDNCTQGASDLDWAAYQAIRGCLTYQCGTGADGHCYEDALDGFICSNLFNLCQ